jgi:hypothetical protein
MAIDYSAEADKVDAEIAAMYESQADEADDAEEQDSPGEVNDAGTESGEVKNQEQESNDGPHDSTPVVEEVKQNDETQQAVVDEERYKNAVRAMNRAMQEAADLRKQNVARDELIEQLQAQIQQLQEKQAKPADQEAPTLETDGEIDFDEASELYPEMTGPILKLRAKLEKQLAEVSKMVGAVKDEVGEVKHVAEDVKRDKALTAEQKHYAYIAERHPDFNEIVASTEYAEWFPEQAPMVQAALQRGTARDVVTALTLFRTEHPKPVPEVEVETRVAAKATTKQDKLAAAKAASTPDVKSVKPDKKPTFTSAQIAKMSPKEFSIHEAEILEAMARGEIT